MDSIKSFKGYGKVDEAEQQAFKRKTRKRFIIVIVSSVVLVAVIIGAVIGIVMNNGSSKPSDSIPHTDLTPAASLTTVCGVTQHPSSCFSSISSLQSTNITDPEVIFKLSLLVAIKELSKLPGYPSKLLANANNNDLRLRSAFNVCEAVFSNAMDHLNDSLSSIEASQEKKLLSTSNINDMKTWLSASITDQETCLDALEELKLNSTKYENATLIKDLKSSLENPMEYASNSLAIVTKVLGLLTGLNIPIHRRLLEFDENGNSVNTAFPIWVSHGDRKLLQDSNPTPQVTVAQDGSGDVTTINQAVEMVPKKGKTRFVIHVKEGRYEENVILDKGKWNVMIYGDGKEKTIVSGKLNFIDGTATYDTATVAVQGKGFMAKDMKFINTAGAAKHQAVAFRSGSDLSVYYRCSFDGFQDTLYAHSNRQFYKDCDITGTIDFIFGNSAVVFQNCLIQPRQPLPNQFNTITAQGKKDPNQNTGISIQKCTFSPLDSTLTASTYLGRPWKDYSTTVIMQSEIGSFLNPLGWKEWVSNVDPPSTILYGEYQNSGAGSSVDKRVKWVGFKPSLTGVEAGKFTVSTFVQGNDWLPETGVAYEESL